MDKKIKNLGTLNGKILLFGGVYSNLQALEALIEVAKQEDIPSEHCICTGDIVGYCAQPEETIQTFKNWNPHSIVGNVEIQLTNNEDDCGCDFKSGSRCDNFSQQWYPYAKSKVSKNALGYLGRLPDYIKFTYNNFNVFVVHGSYSNVSEYIFKSTPWDVKQETFYKTNSDIIVAGHSGLPFIDAKDNKTWINPGVIGMPANDGTTEVWYAILDDSTKPYCINFRKLAYNHTLTNRLMLNGLLPKSYAKTIIDGIWDNMEILPNEEQRLQGKLIEL
ncbi:diadenosine tetraphosphatase [Winogradskyella sp. J14-2]|uniref:metallophosphoesterase family protein n=1 Tax=Winogradskyella sp. J14-2 TaxID=1936080 RepID=UPI0009726F10|nr:metallophosphoesterase family protein [Winogradskyella sp. J14-2]APY09614.1 diadenosine tetraphosphatase [Winogradskyella sp. J14-2]